MAQNQQQNQNTQSQSAEGGNKSTQLQDGVLGQITVLVNGDTVKETQERFRVNVTGVVGALVADNLAFGNIANDD